MMSPPADLRTTQRVADEADGLDEFPFVVGLDCLGDFIGEPEAKQVDVAAGVCFVDFAVDEGDVWAVEAEVVFDLEAVVVVSLVSVAEEHEFLRCLFWS
jgi:hypothetical protein